MKRALQPSAHRLPSCARVLLGVALAVAGALVGGCRRPPDPRVLRLGYFANLTHAPALTGVASGRFARALGRVRLETHVFGAGPEAMEALLAGAVDVAYVGPAPALTAFTVSRGRAVRVIAGSTTGGALFVVREGSGIRGPADLHGRSLATPQLGNTQDVALRHYLASNGLETTDRGGDVRVTPLANPDILVQLRRGQLDGAWVPEPWGSRLAADANARVLVDERDLWPSRSFVTTVVVARTAYLRAAPANVRALLRAHAAEVAWIRAERQRAAATGAADGALAAVDQAIEGIVGRRLPQRVLRPAWGRLDFATVADESGLRSNADRAFELGFLRTADVRGLVDPLRYASREP